MKLIVAGGRYFSDYNVCRKALDYYLSKITDPIEIVSGACSTGEHTFTRSDGTKVYGADGLGERYAKERNLPVTPYPAQWDLYGKPAGYIRNKEMAGYATHCILFWDGQSKGSSNMNDLAVEYKLKLKVVLYQKN